MLFFRPEVVKLGKSAKNLGKSESVVTGGCKTYLGFPEQMSSESASHRCTGVVHRCALGFYRWPSPDPLLGLSLRLTDFQESSMSSQEALCTRTLVSNITLGCYPKN